MPQAGLIRRPPKDASFVVGLFLLITTLGLAVYLGFKLGKEHTVQKAVMQEPVKAFGSLWLVKAARLPKGATRMKV